MNKAIEFGLLPWYIDSNVSYKLIDSWSGLPFFRIRFTLSLHFTQNVHSMFTQHTLFHELKLLSNQLFSDDDEKIRQNMTSFLWFLADRDYAECFVLEQTFGLRTRFERLVASIDGSGDTIIRRKFLSLIRDYSVSGEDEGLPDELDGPTEDSLGGPGEQEDTRNVPDGLVERAADAPEPVERAADAPDEPTVSCSGEDTEESGNDSGEESEGVVTLHDRISNSPDEIRSTVVINKSLGKVGFDYFMNHKFVTSRQNFQTRRRGIVIQSLGKRTFVAFLCQFSVSDELYDVPDELARWGITSEQCKYKTKFETLSRIFKFTLFESY